MVAVQNIFNAIAFLYIIICTAEALSKSGLRKLLHVYNGCTTHLKQDQFSSSRSNQLKALSGEPKAKLVSPTQGIIINTKVFSYNFSLVHKLH